MLSAVEQTYGTSASGSIGAVLNKSREEKNAQHIEAARQGRRVGGAEDVDAKLRGVAEEFVSVFMNQVMKSMRATVQENPAMHGDNGEKFFREMLDTEQSKALAKGSGYGLTDLVYQALSGQARVASSAAAREIEGEVEAAAEAEPVAL